MGNAIASKNFELSLQELLWGFMEFASDAGEESFPPYESWLWHDFLHTLKSDFSGKFPALACIGRFDWNDTSPKCREFDIAMFGLRYQSFAKNPGGRVFLNVENRRDRNPLVKHMPDLAHAALKLARKLPGFFE